MPTFADRVKETSTTTGTGNLTLAGAATGFQTFNTAFGNGATGLSFYYCIEAVDGSGNPSGNWEVGLGHLSASTTLVRDQILSNSAGTTAAINLSAGTVNVFCTMPAFVGQETVSNAMFDAQYGLP